MAEEVSAIEVARKQRHIYLLGKVRQNLPLSRPEIEELKGYEAALAEPSSEHNAETPPPFKLRPMKAVPHRGRLPIAPTRVKVLAFRYPTVVEASDPKVVGDRVDLAAALAQYEILCDAWEQGQFLRQFAELAGQCTTISEIARELQIKPAAEAGKILRNRMDNDYELRQLWQARHFETRRLIYQGYTLALGKGEVSVAGVNRLKQYFQDESELCGRSAGELDLERLSTAGVLSVLRISRNTLYEWVTSKGCPKNADDTYPLAAVLAWRDEYLQEKLVAKAGRPVMAGGVTDYRAAKTKKAWLEAGELEGKLIRSDAHVDLFIRFAQLVANTLSHQTAVEIGRAGEGQTAQQVTALLDRQFADLRSKLTAQPPTVRLSPAALEHYQTLLQEMSIPASPEEQVTSDPASAGATSDK